MNNINPSAQKCRDIFYRLCGDSLPSPQDDGNVNGIGTQPDEAYDFAAFGVSPPTQMRDPQSASSGTWNGRFNTRADSASSGIAPDQLERHHQPPRAQRPQRPSMPPPLASTDPWMTEIDTAIDGYDVYVDRLTAAAGASNGLNMQASDGTDPSMMSQDWASQQHHQLHQQQAGADGRSTGQMNSGSDGLYNNPIIGLGMGMPTVGSNGMWGTDMENGAQDWDWGLMLAGGH